MVWESHNVRELNEDYSDMSNEVTVCKTWLWWLLNFWAAIAQMTLHIELMHTRHRWIDSVEYNRHSIFNCRILDVRFGRKVEVSGFKSGYLFLTNLSFLHYQLWLLFYFNCNFCIISLEYVQQALGDLIANFFGKGSTT